MPTSTFFRLPDEKKTRLIEAAWGEFTGARLSDVSINRIIHAAHIPRGSFYQYFEDKNDLFLYLLGDVQRKLLAMLEQALTIAEGDIFQTPPLMFDSAVHCAGGDLVVQRWLKVLSLNPSVDLMRVFDPQPERLLDAVWDRIDRSKLRRGDRAFVCRLLSMLIVATCSAIGEAMARPENAAALRAALVECTDILKFGGAAGCRCDEERMAIC